MLEFNTWNILYSIIILTGIFKQMNCTKNDECIPRKYLADGFVCVCNSTYCDSIEPLPKDWIENQYVAYISTESGLRMEQTINTYEINRSDDGYDLKISRDKTYQQIMGFGGAMTDATGINIASLPKSAQNLLMKQYFGDDGIQYTIIRVPIGGSDFSTHPYTLDDTPNDINLTDFKLADEDIKYKIPYLHQAINLSTQYPVKLMGCAWSAPAYMKENNHIRGRGSLLPKYYQTYANYLIKFLLAYKNQGFDFDILSAQNEPITPIYIFNAMGWFPISQAEFVGNILGPTLEINGLDYIKILIGDDQRPFMYDWVYSVLQNEKAAKYVSGVGVHWYLDFVTPPEVLTDIHNIPGFDDKFILYTEACNGAFGSQRGVSLGSWASGESYLENIIDDLNNWSEGWVDWNLVLDLQGGPNWADNFVDAPIIVNASSQEFYKNPMYYAMAHVSKFLVPGSVRINLENTHSKIKATAFDRPDNLTVIIAINIYNESYSLSIQDLDRNASKWITVPSKSFTTFIYL